MIRHRRIVLLLVAALALMIAHAEAQPSAGTINAKQTGTWNLTNISGTITLPTGAATSAKQPTIGTAGSASGDVLTIQGIAGMTKLLVTPDSVALPANQSVNVNQINGVTPLMGAGNGGTGSLRVNIASDQVSIPVTQGALTTLATGQQAVTSSAVALPSNAAKSFCVKVLSGGTQDVYFGVSGVTTATGFPLSPGDSDCFALSNTSTVFVIAGSSGSTVAFRAVN